MADRLLGGDGEHADAAPADRLGPFETRDGRLADRPLDDERVPGHVGGEDAVRAIDLARWSAVFDYGELGGGHDGGRHPAGGPELFGAGNEDRHLGALATEAPTTYRSVLAELAHLVKAGVYVPTPTRVHAMADGPAVLAQLAEGRTQGKHALDPWR